MTPPLSQPPTHLPSGRLKGHIAFVTGCASGVGLEIARVFHAEGAKVTATDIDETGLHGALVESESLHLRVLDVTDESACRAAVEEAHQRFADMPDVLVNNAGATIRGSIEETDSELFNRTIDVNLGSAVRLARLIAPSMRERGRGSIVNMASITATEGQANTVAYTASKGGLTAMTRALAVELGPSGVRVNSISPTVIDTPMTHSHVQSTPNPEARYQDLRGRQPMGRIASALDVALAALFLASDESTFITGIDLPVDGGRAAS